MLTLPLSLAGCKSDSDGAELYDSACARCHGAQGQGGISTGQTRSRDLRTPDWQDRATDAELRKVIRNGRGEMPAFGSVLSLDRIDRIVRHIRTLKQHDEE